MIDFNHLYMDCFCQDLASNSHPPFSVHLPKSCINGQGVNVYEQWHEISNNVVCATSETSD